MTDDPLDKLIDKTHMPVPAPGPKKPHKKWKLKPPNNPAPHVMRAMRFSLRQIEILAPIVKRIGYAQYIENLISHDMRENGQVWPKDIFRNSPKDKKSRR